MNYIRNVNNFVSTLSYRHVWKIVGNFHRVMKEDCASLNKNNENSQCEVRFPGYKKLLVFHPIPNLQICSFT